MAPLEACCVCYERPPAVLLPTCGHAALCAECFAVLLARDDEPSCPQCRAPMAALALPAPADGAGFVAAERRLEALLALCSTHDERTADALTALDMFVAASLEQHALALAGGAVRTTCAAMQRSVDTVVHRAGARTLLEFGSFCESSEPALALALAAACKDCQPHAALLHALRLACGARRSGRVFAAAADAMYALHLPDEGPALATRLVALMLRALTEHSG
jgi:hypothetical protein